MESEDEDVIFENSVLHRALLDLGVTDLKTEPRLQVEESDDTAPRIGRVADDLSDDIRVKALCGVHSSLSACIFYSQTSLEEVHHYHRYHTLNRLVSSPLLSEDDQLFLQSFVDEKAQRKHPSECLAVHSFSFCSFLVASVIFVNVLCPVDVLSARAVSVINSLPAAQFLWLHLVTDITVRVLINVAWILLVVPSLVLLKKGVRQKVLGEMQRQDRSIEDLLSKALALMLVEKKCLKLIKECELVARGFMLASQHHVASRSGQNHVASTSDHLCSGLRQVMFTENLALMQELKKWVVKMMRGIPMICVESDYSMLEELEVIEKSPVTQNITGDSNRGADLLQEYAVISPSLLASSVDLLSVYMSGCIRRLALCFYQPNLKDKSLNPYLATQECVEMCRKAVERVQTLLKQSYTFYRAVHQPRERGTLQKEQRSQHSERSQIYKLYICVNSLDLHLQSLLQLTRELTLTLEDRVDKEQSREAAVGDSVPDTISADDRDLWAVILKRIKSGLDSCRGCYEESLKHVSRRTNTDKQVKSPVKESSHKVTEPQQTKTVWIPAEDPVIVDQVFEAVTDSVEDSDFQESKTQYSAEDRIRHQEEKEAIKRFRQELQTVVGHRAILQKIREDRALARARGQTVLIQETVSGLSLIQDPESSADIHTQSEVLTDEQASAETDISLAATELKHTKFVKPGSVFSVLEEEELHACTIEDGSIIGQHHRQCIHPEPVLKENIVTHNLTAPAVTASLLCRDDPECGLQHQPAEKLSCTKENSDHVRDSQAVSSKFVDFNAHFVHEFHNKDSIELRNSSEIGLGGNYLLISEKDDEENHIFSAVSEDIQNNQAGCCDQSLISCFKCEHTSNSRQTSERCENNCEKMMTADDSRFHFLSKKKDADLGKVQGESLGQSVAYIPGTSFSKSLALQAVARAKALPTSYLEEEQFGDDSSESESDSFEGS